jgi:transcription elongation factor GreA-like protein
MIKKFLMKQMMKKQLANVPEAEQERILNVVEKNPDLFLKIGAEIQEKMKGGKDQMAAAMEVMQKYKEELTSAMK